MKRTRITSVDFNPWLKLLWVGRLPIKLKRGYCGGVRYRQYRQTPKAFDRIWRRTYEAGWIWNQDGNGYHLRRP